MADALRVLMTADCVGGVFTYALALARELGRLGAEVHLATMGEPMRPAQREESSAVPSLVVHESRYALEWMESPWAEVDAAGRWLVGLAHDLGVDVVHLNGYAQGDAGFPAPVVVAGHSCVASWWVAVHGEEAPPSLRTYRERVRAGIRAAGAVIAPSAAMLEALARHHGPLRSPSVVPNGLSAMPARVAARREPFVLAAGRVWDRAKNLSVLEQVAPRVSHPIRVAGSDAHPDGTACPLRGVTALGWLAPADLAREMDRAAVFVAPALYEPFGLGPLEAASRGCALVVSDIPSLREIWGDAALFVPPADADAIARALGGLLEDDLFRARMASHARERAARFTAAAMARGTLAAYARAGAARAGRLLQAHGGDACAS